MNENNHVINDFEKRAGRYETDSLWITSEAINKVPLSFFINLDSLGDLIDVGGGTGYLTQYLSSHIGYKSLTVLDLSPAMLNIAKKRLPDASIICDSIEHFKELNNSQYDTIVARQILHYVDDVKKTIKTLKTAMKENGLLYIGQFVVPGVLSDYWHASFIKKISVNRKRSFIQDDFLSLFVDEGLKIQKTIYTPYEENIKSFYKRKTNQDLNYHELYSYAVGSLNEDVKKELLIKITDDNLFFTVQFCHLLLSK